MNKAVHFSILVDETKDVGKVEQLSVVVRYVNKDEDVTVNERFLGFVPAEDLTAESLIKYILDTLSRHNINVNNLVSQGYDGAAVMSGKCSHCSDMYSAACSPSSLCAL